MAKKLCFILILSICLLIVGTSYAQEESPSPATSPEHETLTESPLPPSSPESDSSPSPKADSLPPQASSPKADSFPPQASSPAPESLADSPPPPPPPPQPESPSPSSSSSPSPGPAPVPAPSDDDDSDEDSEPETEYFPSPAPSPVQEEGEPNDIKASEDGDEFDDEGGQDNGMSGLKKAGIAIGAILGVGAIVIGALVYKKRRDNLTRARYTYFEQGEFL
ncbi:proline-rich receptor-like protein kinase PERK8 [Eutrema salsugineum]|nr:proline-rich receptor-like protein kinase PERK8 [Eutrema salsugineum]